MHVLVIIPDFVFALRSLRLVKHLFSDLFGLGGCFKNMIRRDKGGKFDESGVLIIKYQFYSGKKMSKEKLSKAKYNSLLKMQKDDPMKIMAEQGKGRNWWMFQGEFYIENEGLGSEEVKAFALSKANKKRG